MRTQLVFSPKEAKKVLSEVEFDIATGKKVSTVGTGTFDSKFISGKLRIYLRGSNLIKRTLFVLE